MLSPSKLIPKAEAAKFARQLQRLNKERLDDGLGWSEAKSSSSRQTETKIFDGSRDWPVAKLYIERERRVAAGAGSSVDVQQHVKRARWFVDQRDMAARVLQARSHFPWLCAPSFNEEKKIWECSNCDNIAMSVARLLDVRTGSVCLRRELQDVILIPGFAIQS